MKKNLMMRAASVLLVAVMLTTCAISGTFAKYVTSDNSTDSARVAKWGVSVVASGDDLFNNEYTDATNGLTVKSKTPENENVVAPGTSNAEFGASGLTFAISGTPEVKVKVSFDFTVTKEIYLGVGDYDNDTTGADDGTYNVATPYYPVVFTLTRGGSPVATGNLAAIKAYFDGLTSTNTNVPANTPLNDVFVLTWAWEFGDSANNLKDTTLGNLAAGTTTTTNEYSLDLEYALAITVEQIN